MTSDTGAVTPYSGVVVTPSQVTSPGDSLTHQFCNVVRHLITYSGAYRSESEETAHLAVVDRYEKSALGGALRYLNTEGDQAPREDVSQRAAPAGSAVVVPPAALTDDNDQLAAAMVRAQQAEKD